MPVRVGAALVGAALLAPAPSARAQQLELRLAPRIGAFVPAGRLVREHDGLIRFRADLAPSLAVGLGLELDAPRLRLGVRAAVDYATAPTLVAHGFTVDSAGVGLLVAGADVVLRPLDGRARVRPFLAAGAGLKRYLVPEAGLTRALAGVLPSDRTDPALHGAAGAEARWGPIGVVAEAGDYVSWFLAPSTGHQRVQHDLLVTLGLRLRLL
ncbi:MAG: hypothetical protein IRZ00_07925 [Gemmatimonadetes bacterium]|nr:hypothetical protein [Gemmatimonadota bacterium]